MPIGEPVIGAFGIFEERSELCRILAGCDSCEVPEEECEIDLLLGEDVDRSFKEGGSPILGDVMVQSELRPKTGEVA